LGEPRWSPDGARLAWLEVDRGVVELLVAPVGPGAAREGLTGPPVRVTAEVGVTKLGAYGGGGYCWAPSATAGATPELVYATDDRRLVAIPCHGGPVRVLAEGAATAAPAVSPDGTRVAFVRETDDECAVAVVALAGGEDPRVVSRADYAWDPEWAPDGVALAWHEWDLPAMPWDSSRIVLARPGVLGDRVHVVAGGDGVAVAQPRFSPDGTALAYVSDATGWSNVWVAAADGTGARPLLEEACEHAEPSWGPGQRSYAWSPDGQRIALCRNEEGFGRLVVVDVGSRGVHERAKGWHHGLDWGDRGIACVRSGGRTPPQVTVLDPAGEGGHGRRALARGAPGELDALDLPEPEPVAWRGSDGTTVHGILWRPLVPAAGPPLLVEVHGGPTGQAVVGWVPRVRWFLSRGWAVLAPNPRGSSGYGRAYLRALDGEWGVADVDDTVTGIRAAGERGWADPERVAVMGGSAGGFTALLVGTARPPVARAVVSLYGVTDLAELAATTHRFESRYLDTLVGSLPAAAAEYRGRSPVHRASDVSVPVLLLQGDQDKVVPLAQAQRLEAALRDAGAPVELHVYEGEGHGWSRPETVIDALARTEDFLTRWVLS
jgi:dipeptidyl aminopeptidase/acylaminoacyl peptidase